jgi:hypothetical protein
VGYDCTYKDGRRRDAERERASEAAPHGKCTTIESMFFFGFNAVSHFRDVFSGTRKLTYIPESPETAAPKTAVPCIYNQREIQGLCESIRRAGWGGRVLRFCKSHIVKAARLSHAKG